MQKINIERLDIADWSEFYRLFRRRLEADFKEIPLAGKKNFLKGKYSSSFSATNRDFYRHVGFQFEGVKKNDRWRKDRYLLGKQIS